MTSEEILKKYSITPEEKAKISEIAEGILTYNKKPVDKPICIIVGGQTGAGKSGLIAYSAKMFPDGNAIILEDDSLRHFYPNEQFLSETYPNEYIAITNQLTNSLTSDLFKKFAQTGYNIIFHQTLKNTRIANEGIPMLKEKGYSVVVRGLAVCNLESRISMIERCLGQLQYKGYCRNVTTSDHDNTYNGMPDTLQYIEENGRYDVLEIFRRGKELEYPHIVYANTNPDRPGAVMNISKHPEVSRGSRPMGHESAKDALLAAREEDRVEFFSGTDCRKPYDDRLEEIQSNPYLNPVISEQLYELKGLINESLIQEQNNSTTE